MSSGCAINAIYSIVCVDAETGDGGTLPQNTDLHAERFHKHVICDLEELTSKAIDRRVQVTYEGSQKWEGVWGRGQKERTFRVKLRIGYFVGNHEAMSAPVIADDEHDIGKRLQNAALWPTCTNGCIQGLVARTSRVIKVEPDRVILEMDIEATVIA